MDLSDLQAVAKSAAPAPRVATETVTEAPPVATPRRVATKRPAATTEPKPVTQPAVANEVATATEARPPVRTTVDLQFEEYREFLKWCAVAADELGRPRVPGQEVMRVLVRRLVADDRLGRQITGDLKKHAGKLSNKF